MGRSYTPTYRLETTGGDFGTNLGWDSSKGQPTSDNIGKYLMALSRSTHIGGCNEHLSKALGRIGNLPKSARIIRQSTGCVVAEWVHPPFLVM